MDSEYFQVKLNTYFENKISEIKTKAVEIRETKKLKAKTTNTNSETKNDSNNNTDTTQTKD